MCWNNNSCIFFFYGKYLVKIFDGIDIDLSKVKFEYIKF